MILSTHKVWRRSRRVLAAKGIHPRVKRRPSDEYAYRFLAVGPFELWQQRDPRPRWRTVLSLSWWSRMQLRVHVVL